MRSHGVVRGGIIVPVIIPPVVDVLVVPVVEDVLTRSLRGYFYSGLNRNFETRTQSHLSEHASLLGRAPPRRFCGVDEESTPAADEAATREDIYPHL